MHNGTITTQQQYFLPEWNVRNNSPDLIGPPCYNQSSLK